MNARDHEQAVLSAIESQFRTEEPELIADFRAFSSVASPIKPLAGRYRPAPRGKRWRNPDRSGFAIELICLVCALLAVLAGIAACI